jgi:hypothetical protein
MPARKHEQFTSIVLTADYCMPVRSMHVGVAVLLPRTQSNEHLKK